ncbi:hypothetical protein [Streptomyces sp. NL15-2K]|uniref:sodium:solute symporter family transporter n=1 Tax=Streptomyces sp. NL15-2K TaxID=376149 RepID=UPI000F588BCF|nr:MULTISPECIES: hypothetical protein [Actinomycetes]WKX06755.1 hypothetical protein Q4V64_04285 [Kutzneria buriramensis]GCB52553.1 comA operon protein 2 [Streptomyces sp. NL15-2K]
MGDHRRIVGPMPVEGNTQVYGLLRGGAAAVLAESLGSCGAVLQAGPGRFAVGIDLNVTHLTTFSMSVAASCIFPVLIYSFFWHRFNRTGLLWSVYGGLVLSVALTILSPTVSGSEFALWPDASFDLYPFQTPGLVSVPVAFLLGWLGSIASPERSPSDFRQVEHQLLTGREVGPKAR